LEQVK